MKNCIKCGKNKELNDFKYLSVSSSILKDSRTIICKKCLHKRSKKKDKSNHIKWQKPEWSMKCLERDSFTCKHCNYQGLDLVVHHLDESRSLGYKNMNNNLDNLITLCRKCHAIIHGFDKKYKNGKIKKILEMREKGLTFIEIGNKLGISRQRVHQLIRHKITS